MASEEQKRYIQLESDAVMEDEIALLSAAQRIAITKVFKDADFDQTILQSKEILQLTFKHEDTKRDLADNLCRLVKHTGSNLTKIFKIMGFLVNTDAAFGNLQDGVKDIVDTLQNTGIDGEATLINRIKLLEKNAQTAGLSEENILNLRDVSENLETLQNSFNHLNDDLGTFNFTSVAKSIETIEGKLSTADPVITDTLSKANLTKIGNLLTRVQNIERNQTLFNDWKQEVMAELQTVSRAKDEAEKDRNETKGILKEIRELKLAIDQSPAAISMEKRTLGSAKIPELKSLDPSDFRTWRDLFNTHAKLQAWPASTKQQALKLAVPDPKLYVPLKLAAPDFDRLSATQILEKWEKRCCPDSHRDLAITQLSQLHQGLDEGSLQYIDRAVELYIMAQFEGDARDPENDLQFIQRLINTFRDTRLRAPLRRRKPETVAQLRLALNEEMNIIEDDPTTTAQVAAVAKPATATQVAAIDGKNSNVKKVLRCTFCGETHDAAKCRKTFALIQMMQKASAPNSNNDNRQNNNQNQRGGGNPQGRGRGGRGFRGRGRGYGGAPKRGNSDNPNGGNENHPPPKKEKWQNQDNQKN